ncbi:MAG TPA: LuxR C-terminal-related transcriptional regulator [Microbacterium sp.]|nr:LuxR C-terminal-related transcriptional regulator [Microbacterium sp.]
MRAPAFELLESKLRPPPGRAGAVPRSQLIDLLEPESSAVPVIFISAGPGWGKTTLLTQWAARSQRPFAWVSIDANDNDPIVLMTYIATALGRVSSLDSSVFEALSAGASIEGTVVPRLGMTLATMDEAVVFVFDDLHLLDSRPCLDAIAALAMHVTAGSQMVLSARGRPALPLGALRARGLTLEMGPDELRLDETEAHQLLSAAGLDLADREVAELTEHTEGWSAGLYLAALAAKASGAGVTSATSFRGDDRFVADYLVPELLSRLPREELRFLTRTAVLEPMSGPLCDAVLEERNSAAMLDSLAGSNLFLVPLDRTGEWYRYHHLFRELLRSELERLEPDLVTRLLARAADWFEARGQMETAIGYAQAAGDLDRVARLVGRSCLATYQSGRAATLERWIDWLDGHGALERDASVAALAGILAPVWGRAAEAERWGDLAERASYEGTLPDGTPSIDAWLALMRVMSCRSGAASMRADAELAVATLARGSLFWPNARVMHAIALWLTGAVDQADDLFAEVAEEAEEVGAANAVSVCLAERGAIALGRGGWVQAEELADRAFRVIRHSFLEEYPTSSLVYAVGARVAAHRGDPHGAQVFLARAQRLRSRLTYALPYYAVQTRLELARAFLALADGGGAATMLRETEAILRRRPDLGTLPAEVSELRDSLNTMQVQAPGVSTLTEAELRLLPHLATHLSFREIGERLFLSRHTVKSHAMAIYRKLNVASRNAAVERARELGLL